MKKDSTVGTSAGDASSPDELKGQALMNEAEKKLKPNPLTSWIPGFGAIPYDEAADDFKRAGNLFKVARNLQKAGQAYYRAGEVLLLAKSVVEAANAFADAAGCWKKTSPQESANCLERVVELLAGEGRFSMAAKHQKDLAELYEKDIGNLEEAMKNYETAAEMLEQENSASAAKPCWVKVAAYAADAGEYPKAIEIYEKVAKSCLDSRLSSYGAKEWFFKAAVCHLAQGDVVGTKKAVERYKSMHPNFERERECELLEKMVKAIEEFDVAGFTKAVFVYDEVTKLEDLLVRLLNKVKKGIVEGDDGEESEEAEESEKTLNKNNSKKHPEVGTSESNAAQQQQVTEKKKDDGGLPPVEHLSDSEEDEGGLE